MGSGDSIGSSTTSFDSLGRALAYTETSTQSGGTLTYNQTLGYATNGKLASASQSQVSGASVAYAYHANDGTASANRISSMKVMQGTTVLSETDYTYDSSGRLATVTAQSGTSAAQTFTYGYTSNNLVSSVTRSAGPMTAYVYQTTGTGDQLSSITTSTTGTSAATVYGMAYTGFNAKGQALGAAVSGTGATADTLGYSYDAHGELLSASHTSGAATTNYSYDAAGNRTDLGAVNANNQYGNFTYDARGNLTDDGTRTYTYDPINELTVVTPKSPTAGSVKVTMGYDSQGRRAWKKSFAWDTTLNGGAGGWSATPATYLKFAYDGMNLVAEFSSSGTTDTLLQTYAWNRNASGGVGGLLSITDYTSTPKTYLTFFDGNGNVTGLTDAATGAVAATYTYDSFGNLTASTGTAVNHFRFSTKYLDGETGLYYYGYRFYSPAQNRFITRDPSGAMNGGPNLYAFVGNDAVNEVDSIGLDAYPFPKIPQSLAPPIPTFHPDLGNPVLVDQEQDPPLSSFYQTVSDADMRSWGWNQMDINAAGGNFVRYIPNIADQLRLWHLDPSLTQSKKVPCQGTNVTYYSDGRWSVFALDIYTKGTKTGVKYFKNFKALQNHYDQSALTVIAAAMEAFSTAQQTQAQAQALSGAISSATTGSALRLSFAPPSRSSPRSGSGAPVCEGGTAKGQGSSIGWEFDFPGCFCAGTLVLTSRGARPIERIRVGQRVVTTQEGEEQPTELEINPADYVLVRLAYLEPKSGELMAVSLLRRRKLIEGIGTGDTVKLSVLELGVDDSARVVALDPCPTIERGDGRLVTGTFRSVNPDVRLLHLEGLQEPIAVTGCHPIYSEDRHCFTPVETLAVGERLRTRSETAVVRSIGRAPGGHLVFNLEIGEIHQYYVSQLHVLAHNGSAAVNTVKSRTFTSPDPLVGDLANEIEAAYPGHVVDVNVPLQSPLGNTDADILLQNAVLQVKSGRSAQGLLLQLQKSEAATGLPSIGFGPNLPAASLRTLSQQGGLVTGDNSLLLQLIKP